MGKWKLGLLALALTSLAQIAWASDADVAQQFGLLGSWAADCTQPAAPGNPFQVFALAPDGSILRTLNMGDGNALNGASSLHNLRLVGDDKMAATWVRASDGAVTTTTAQRSGNKNRGWESVTADGTAVIQNGLFTNSGKPTPWFEKCSEP